MWGTFTDCDLLYMTIGEALILFYADWTNGQNGGGIQTQFVTRNGNLRKVPERRIVTQESRAGRFGGLVPIVEDVKKADKLLDRPVSRKPVKKPKNVPTIKSEGSCPDHTRHDVMCHNVTHVLLAGRPSCPVRQVTSPGYPNAYPANRHCNLTIKSPDDPGLALRLWFSFFQLEDGHDWIKITQDKRGKGNKEVGREKVYSGRDIPPPFIADTGQVSLLFHSDEDLEEGGFVLHYETIQRSDKTIPVVKEACPSEVVVLRGEASGTITSPLYPQDYAHNLVCRWRIEAGNDKALVRLRVDQKDFHTEAQHDTLTITTDKETVPLSGKLDEDLILFSHSSVLLEFATDSQKSASGFQLHYDIIPQNVSTVVVRGTSGVLQSPGYPLDYPLNHRLTWVVHGSPAGSLLRIIDFQLEAHQSPDHLIVAQGDNLDKGIVSTLFGNIEDLTSSVIALPNASTFVVHFSSSWHTQPKRGWLLTFQPLEASEQVRPSFHRHNNQHHGIPEEPLEINFDSLRRGSSQRLLTSGQHSLSADMAAASPSRLSYPAGYAPPASSSSFSLRGVGTFSTVPLMELDVQPFHPQQDWQGDLKECLGSLLPRSILRAQRKPVLTTTVLEWRKDDVVRVMITTSEGADDLVVQLKNALSSGKIRCNDSLEMYLPDLLRDVHSSINGQNWLLASVCIIAFFLIIFSAVLFVHCKQRRVIVRKLRSSTTSSENSQIETFNPSDRGFPPSSLSNTVTNTITSTVRCKQVLSVAMEPSVQRNPLYDLGSSKQPVWNNGDVLKDIVNSNMLTRKSSKTPSPTGTNNVVFRQSTDETIDLMEVLRMYPQKLSRAKSSMGGSVINQEIPSLTKGYDVDEVGRKVTMDHRRLVEEDETESTRSVGSPSSFDCQLEAETGETVEILHEVMPDSEESIAISTAISQLNEWRNGKPMTVRAVKQKNLLKKQIKQEIFEDLHFQKSPEDKGVSA